QWERLLAREHEMTDPEGRLDRAPAVERDIEPDEQIAREQRSHDRFGLARMAAHAPVSRQVGRETLATQIRVSAALVVGLRMNDIPTQAGARHAAFPPLGRAAPTESRSKAGA